MRKHGLRALGLSFLAVMGLMAFMVAGAQGAFLYLKEEPAGSGKFVTKTLAVESEPTISMHSEHGVLLVGDLNFEILCKKVESDPTAKVKLLANSTVAHGHLLFKECESFEIENKVTKVKLTLLGKCKPWSTSTGKESGEILAGGLAELILHEGKTVVLFKPLTGTAVFTKIELPETCALAESSEITGELVAECGELNPPNTFVGGDCATHRETQLLKAITPALAEKITGNPKLKFGEHVAELHGIAAVKFGEPCINCKWSGDAI